MGQAQDAEDEAIGVYGRSYGGARGYGVVGSAYDGTLFNRGLYGVASGDGDALVYGLYAVAGGTASERYAGYFSGDVHVTGTLTHASDGKLKEGVEALGGGEVLSKLMRLRPRRYKYKRDGRGKRLGFSGKARYGFIAQEVEQVFPDLVSEETHALPEEPGEGEEGSAGSAELVTYKALNYTDLIPLLVQALQEQQARIEALEAQLGGKKRK